jgi:AcrR family transcriptional regulator
MTASGTARARVRAQLTSEIKDAARAELAVAGSSGLSLRAVARRLDMVPSALYRYFDGRDALLTALIIDAYASLAAAVVAADQRGGPGPRRRWLAIGHAVRSWAWDHRPEWALIYGSPVPGYEAPQDTLGPALELVRVMAAIVGPQQSEMLPMVLPIDADLVEWLDVVSDPVFSGAARDVVALAVVAYTHLLGAVSLELFGQFGPDATPAPAIFDYGLRVTATLLGLPEESATDAGQADVSRPAVSIRLRDPTP